MILTVSVFLFIWTKNTITVVKDVFDKKKSRYIFFYIYIHNRKFNAELNKLIKTVFIRKMILNTPTFANKFDFIWKLSGP